MEFRLIYKGRLPAESSKSRTEDKRRIRKQLHPQLKKLWTDHKMLRVMGRFDFEPTDVDGMTATIREIASKHKVVSVHNHIHSFVPLIGEYSYTSCSLDILFLRRDAPGGLVKHGGDIDNRIKVLFDALSKPPDANHVEDAPPAEDPLFCLLDDDQYIDQVTVKTDRLLLPQESNEGVHDVLLVIGVKTSVFNVKRADVAFWS
jgi:hypothetical protein